MKYLNRKLSRLAVLSLLVLIATLLISSAALAQQEARVYVQPVGTAEGVLTVDVMAENVTDMYGAEFRLKYDPAMMIGFFVSIRNARNISFFAQFNYVKLQTKDVFTIEVDPATYLTFPDLRLYQIFGTEERTLIDLGIARYYDWGENLEAYVEGGLNLSSTNVISSKIKIEDLEYSLVNVYLNQNYVPNAQTTEYNIKQGGIGYGLFFGSGIKLYFNESLSLDPGFNIYFKKINLNGYQKFTFHYNFFIRFTFKDLFQENN